MSKSFQSPTLLIKRLHYAKNIHTTGLCLSETKILKDSVAPAHPVSHIRKAFFVKQPNENPHENNLRNLKISTQDFVHQFWLVNNTQYQKEKLEFEGELLKKFGEVKPEDLTPFYIRFLEKI
ncbi:Apoptogenic protein 1, mitochondrial [Entomophthora muscae]|uniref:Apoptogenic protein 1, mitochondrial n=1 Tax=Entomophthora muscae TaxID=34485 RepID=A0ACC2TUH4_9FUNG|nr:Apoptogenic protein 1, mitochondrial [Entomophthora muscae]